MATTKFTKKSPKKTPRKDIEDAGEPEPPRGKRSPSKGARGQRADTSDADIHHKARGTGKAKPGAKRPAARKKAAAEPAELELRPDRDGATAQRNARKRAPNAGVALEGSDTGKPSRKSTRSSANRLKQGTELTKREIRRTASPEKRAERAAATKRSGRGAGKGVAKVPRGGAGKGGRGK